MSVRTSGVESADCVIVGGGPAGMMAAIAAAQAGRRVVLLEQLDRPGAKLLASGGGRCNLTNVLEPEEFMARFGRQGRFMQPALAALDSSGLRQFLDSLGVPTDAPDGFHVYPRSNSAVTVQSALWRRAKQLHVTVRTGVRVTGLWLEPAAKKGQGPAFVLRGVETGDGRIAAPRIVIAAGGRGYPALGGTGTGYALAEQAGHTIVTPTPALVPLVAREPWVRRCAGVTLTAARVWIDLPRQSRAGVTGDVLFTHTGLSGPAILDLSGDVAALLTPSATSAAATVPLRLDLAPGTTPAEWAARFDRWQRVGGGKTVRALVDRHLPRLLAATLCDLAGIGPAALPAHVSRPVRERLAELLTALTLAITATEGWPHAMVTRGGVSLKEIDPAALRSKRLAGLSFAGEILDLDGPSGGFNLQWAFSSGHLAGRSI